MPGEPPLSAASPCPLQVFSNAWTLGAPGLHRSLDKLLVTWTGVFPPATLDAVRARLAAPQPAPQPANGGGAYGYGPMHAHTEAGPKPMMQDPRLMGPPQTHYPQQHPPQHQYPGGFYDYGMPQPVHYPGAPPPVAYPPQQQHLQQFYPPPHAQPQPMVPQYHGYASPPSPQQQQQGPPQQSGAQAALPDLLSSLLSSGLLAGGAAAPAPSAPQVKKDQPAATVGRGFPASVEFAADRIKVPRQCSTHKNPRNYVACVAVSSLPCCACPCCIRWAPEKESGLGGGERRSKSGGAASAHPSVPLAP